MKIIKNAFNDNSNIIGYEIPLHTPDWYTFRTTGIPEVYEGGFGASEISTVCGKSHPKYGKIIPVLLHEKSGITLPEKKMNEHIFSGILGEPMILERHRYWDGSEMGYLQNYMDGKVIREHKRVEMYLVNQKYPWLFASLDAAILKGQGGLLRSGQMLTEDVPLECKQLSYFAAQTWESKIPPQYVYQINQQMLVTETEYAELAVLQDGYSFNVYPFEMNLEICEEILEKSRYQWENVRRMRKLNEAKNYYIDQNQMLKAEQTQAELDSMIPEPDGHEGWKEFLNERLIVEKESFPGTTKEFRMVIKRARMKYAIKLLEEACDSIENKLRALFVKNNAEIMEFDGAGRVKYSRVANRKDPQFNFMGVKRARDNKDEQMVTDQIEPLINK